MIIITVDDTKVQAELKDIQNDVKKIVHAVAVDLERSLEAEGGQIHPDLGSGWQPTGTSPWMRTVSAPDEAWWAHFVAGGTKAHGPSKANVMLFEVDGETVAASHVSGIAANPFDERAVARTKSHVNEIVRRLIS